MKGVLFSIIVSALTTTCFSNAVYNKEVWRALEIGAEFDVMFRVVDADGFPIANARCGGWMYMEHGQKHGNGYATYTDTNGCARVTGKCGEWFSVVVRKDGYYKTSFDVRYPLEYVDTPILDGKWQPYGEIRTVVLKKIRNPIRLRDPNARYSFKYPESGKWTGFDLECCDWVPPLGGGKCADIMIRYIRKPRPDGYFKSLDISFTNNPCAGAYVMDRESYSEMDSVYEANTNGEYVGSLRYEFERTAKGNHVISELGFGQYIVFRIRTKTDEEGNLISAHYGRIMGALQYLEKAGMIFGPVFYNPTPNDTNLEDAETARKSRLGYKQQIEFERRRKAQ